MKAIIAILIIGASITGYFAFEQYNKCEEIEKKLIKREQRIAELQNVNKVVLQALARWTRK